MAEALIPGGVIEADSYGIGEPSNGRTQGRFRPLALLLVAPSLLDAQRLRVGLAIRGYIALLYGFEERTDDRMGIVKVTHGPKIMQAGRDLLGGKSVPFFDRRCLDNLNPLSGLPAEPIRLWDSGRGRRQVAALLQTRLGVGQGIGENPNVLLDTGQTNSEFRAR